jgi:cytochrome c peroxidase
MVTAPYFHDGRAPTLQNAVDTMAKVQLGRTLTHEEISLLVTGPRAIGSISRHLADGIGNLVEQRRQLLAVVEPTPGEF